MRVRKQSEKTAHILIDYERLEARRRGLFGALQPGKDADPRIG